MFLFSSVKPPAASGKSYADLVVSQAWPPSPLWPGRWLFTGIGRLSGSSQRGCEILLCVGPFNLFCRGNLFNLFKHQFIVEKCPLTTINSTKQSHPFRLVLPNRNTTQAICIVLNFLVAIVLKKLKTGEINLNDTAQDIQRLLFQHKINIKITSEIVCILCTKSEIWYVFYI